MLPDRRKAPLELADMKRRGKERQREKTIANPEPLQNSECFRDQEMSQVDKTASLKLKEDQQCKGKEKVSDSAFHDSKDKGLDDSHRRWPQREAAEQATELIHKHYQGKRSFTAQLKDPDLQSMNLQLCTPGYRLLPPTHPKIWSVHQSKLASEVLNNSCVSIGTEVNNDTVKQSLRTKHEEILLQCEDDQAELDLLVEWASAAARRGHDLLEHIQSPEFKQQTSAFGLERHFSAIDLRCIQIIYGDHGLEIIELLRTNASTAVPVVLNRLVQKRDEWSRLRNEMNIVWKEVYSNTYANARGAATSNDCDSKQRKA